MAGAEEGSWQGDAVLPGFVCSVKHSEVLEPSTVLCGAACCNSWTLLAWAGMVEVDRRLRPTLRESGRTAENKWARKGPAWKEIGDV